MGPRPIFIADGHHRYETGLRFRDDLAAAGALTGPDDPANFCMMMLVGMSDPGLVILPTHRLVSGFPGLTFEALAERLAPEFDVSDAGRGDEGCRAAWAAIESDGGQDWLGFGTVADGRWMTARLRSDATMDALAPDHSADWRSLGVSILHELVLKALLGPTRDRVLPLRPPPRRGRARRGGRRLRPGLPRAPRGHGARRVDRLEPGEDAPQEHLLLPQAPQRARPEPPELSPRIASAIKRGRRAPPSPREKVAGTAG